MSAEAQRTEGGIGGGLPTSLNEAQQRARSSCGWCSKIDPRSWDWKNNRVAKIAGVVAALAALALVACILITKYPAASSAFITTSSIVLGGAGLTLLYALIQYCKNRASGTDASSAKRQ